MNTGHVHRTGQNLRPSRYDPVMSGTGHEEEHRAAATCVVWHPAGASISAHLRNALEKRDIEIVPCSMAPEALAQTLQAGRTLKEGGVLILLLVEPSELLDAAPVVSLLRRLGTTCRFWVYVDAEKTPLRELDPGDLGLAPDRTPMAPGGAITATSPAVDPGEGPIGTSDAPGYLRYVEADEGGGSAGPPGAIDEDDDEPGDAFTLTDDELSMLLDDDDGSDDDDA